MKKTVVIILLFHFLLSGQAANAASNLHYKIEMLNWDEVNHLLPKYTKFIVMDVETGKRFKVQRRAGSHHADVQPLTAKDTKIMKKIYSGEWSWKRRAIIVIHDKQWIAASMHGMPHGAGALKNNFPGHFCIHFYGSTTHLTNAMDLSHMLMVLKAAGKLDNYLSQADPYEVLKAFVAGFKQQDAHIVNQASLQKITWKPIVKKIENAEISRMELLPPEDLTDELALDVPVEISWSIKGRGWESFNGVIHMVRFSQVDGWKIDADTFLREAGLPK